MKKKVSYKNNIKSLLEEIDSVANILKETYHNLDDSNGMSDEYEMGFQQEGEEMTPMEGEEEAMPEDENMGSANDAEIIAKIRDAALEGIEAYKNNINNIYYDFYKKTFLACDKVLEDDKNGGQGDVHPMQGGME